MRKDVWHPTKHGLTYGYKCYNVLNNGSKKVRIEVGLDAEKYCDMGAIADWKLDLMFQKILDELNLHNNELVDKAYQKFEECYTRDAKDLRRLRDAEAKLRKIQMKIENLTEMRV
ncbi:MAG: recombinase family protein, partial [Clostridiales bacterium]|nr:recombinase family protein [Clostridiales bacterium]